MASKSSASGISRTCTPMPMEDVQGDNRWMDMVRILINSALLFSPKSYDKWLYCSKFKLT